MRLGLVGEWPDAYARRVFERFPDVEVIQADAGERLDALLFWGRPLERVVEIVTRQPDLAWVHQRAAGV